jgi:hypothetical protein
MLFQARGRLGYKSNSPSLPIGYRLLAICEATVRPGYLQTWMDLHPVRLLDESP